MINHSEYIILVVSDNDKIINIINDSFKDEVQSYFINQAAISGDVFDVIEEQKPDIILLDIDYGEDTKGLDLLMDLRGFELSVEIPVLVMSSSNEDIERAVRFGAGDFLRVPFDRLELTVRVKSLLSLFKLIEGITDQAEDLARQSSELEKKNTQLEIEKTKTDDLLQNILPFEIAEQLKNKGQVKAKKYRLVTIMFTDFKDFTKISSELEPEVIIKELGVYFKKFDEITENHFIEKIKTIGDAYMCVGGLPLRNKSNPIDIVLAAMEIQRFMRDYNALRKAKGHTVWELRLGVHTGEVVAGVIGTKKFAYDIWGDAVNTASRLETAGEPGKINISGETYEYVKDYFICTYRGKIPAKNKGEIDMYFVEGLKSKYREDNDPIKPNEKFQEKLAEF